MAKDSCLARVRRRCCWWDCWLSCWQVLPNGSSTISSKRSAGHNKQNQSDATNKNGSRRKENESRNETEWVEQDEAGVYITIASVPGGVIDLKRVLFRWPSPPRSTTPTPTLGGLTSPKMAVDNAKRTNDSLGQEVIKLRAQVENLTRKAQLQEVELERTTKQLKEAIAIAGEETAKCKAAEEVIKSLTAQLKDMAERLPVGAARNVKSPSLASFGSTPGCNKVGNTSIDRLNVEVTSLEPDLTGSNSQVVPNGSSTISSNRSAGHNKQNQSDATNKNGSRTKENESRNENERVEQDEPGVYITLASVPGGVIDLKRVRFSRKRFSEKEAEQWWAENRARVYEQYNVRVTINSNRSAGHNKQNQSDATYKNGSRTKENESRNETEWVEQDEPGVCITLASVPGGVIDLKRVRFSRKQFSEKQAEQWWAENRARVYEQYNVRVDKSAARVGSEDLAH